MVNLARGYGYAELAGQIIVAVAVGIVLALLVAVTKNIIPGILFHILFNIGGSISKQAVGAKAIVLIVIMVVALRYAIYLKKLWNGYTNSVYLHLVEFMS